MNKGYYPVNYYPVNEMRKSLFRALAFYSRLLCSERIDKTQGIYASRITGNVRFTWQFGEQKSTVILRNIGEHDKVLKRKGAK